MTYESVWYKTNLPLSVINAFLEESQYLETSTATLKNNQTNLDSRNSKVSWIDSNHWISGFCYHYILQANRDNFKYDIAGFGEGVLQYTTYSPGEYYNWHIDTIKNQDPLRKLSFTLQLSDPENYSGGELQFLDEGNQLFFAPKSIGTIVVFDSRLRHRVKKVNSGCRKSIVGWVEGPRWR